MENKEETTAYQPGVLVTVVDETPRQESESEAEHERQNEPTPTPRSLYRNPSDKMVAGVCGGLADFLGVDATLVRVLWVVLTLITGGGGFLAYIALWALLPVGTVRDGKLRAAAIELNDKTLARTAYLLIGLGAVWFLANIGILPRMWSLIWGVVSILFWPAVLIGAGYLLLRGGGRNWRADLNNVTNRVRSGVDGKTPSTDDLKGGLDAVRRHAPLTRSRDDRVIMGVCGGIGERLGIDANLVRLIWAALSVGSIGLGAIVYFALGLLLPEAPATDASGEAEAQNVRVIDGAAS
jgi:phage shock protein PspC (stress-responsive transcriptional regulator)